MAQVERSGKTRHVLEYLTYPGILFCPSKRLLSRNLSAYLRITLAIPGYPS